MQGGFVSETLPSKVLARAFQAGQNLSIDGLIASLAELEEQVYHVKTQQQDRVMAIIEDVEARRREQLESAAMLETGISSALQECQKLDSTLKGVLSVSGETVEKLKLTEERRIRAEQSHRIIRHLVDFAEAGPNLQHLPPEFTVFQGQDAQQKRVAACAKAAELLSVAEELLHRTTGPADSTDFDDGPVQRGTVNLGQLLIAVENLHAHVRRSEEAAVKDFQGACATKDLAGMKRAAELLQALGRGSTLPTLYLDGHPATVPVVPSSDFTDPGERNVALARVILDFQQLISRESEVLRTILQDPERPMAALFTAAVESQLKPIMRNCLVFPSSDATVDEIEDYLEALRSMYERLQAAGIEVASKLAVPCPMIEKLGPAALAEMLAVHVDAEVMLLKALHETLDSAAVISAIAGKTVTTGALERFSKMVDRVVVLSQNSGESLESVQALMYPRTWVKSASLAPASFFGHFAQRVVRGLELAEVLMRAGCDRPLKPGMTAEETTKAVREGLAHAFVAVAMATQLAALVDDFVRSTLLPVMEGPGAREARQNIETGMRLFAGEAEGACEGILQKAQAAVKQQLLQTLSLNTQKSFYKVTGETSPQLDRPTPGISLVASFVRAAARDIQACIPDSGNQERLTEDLARAMFDALESHVGKYTFCSTGALQLKRDLRELQEVAADLKCPAVEKDMAALAEVLGVFLVEPASIPGVIDSMGLLRRKALEMVKLRDDFRSARIAQMLGQ